MADRFLKLAPARLVFALANLPVLPLIAFLLVVAAALAHLFLLPAREAAIDEGERRLAALERSARRTLIEQQAAQVSPADTRQRLLERFPGEDDLNAELGRLIALAAEQGLQVPSGDYRLMPGKDGLFDRYVLNLPVSGSYRAVRRYLSAVCAEFPDLAIDDVSLRRESVASPEVEAQLRFILFGRRNAS
jgi:hypothetical protein